MEIFMGFKLRAQTCVKGVAIVWAGVDLTVANCTAAFLSKVASQPKSMVISNASGASVILYCLLWMACGRTTRTRWLPYACTCCSLLNLLARVSR